MNQKMDTKTNKQGLLSENIQMLSEWGMSEPDLEQIVWEWDENRGGYYFHHSPELIADKIRSFLNLQNKPSTIDVISVLSCRL